MTAPPRRRGALKAAAIVAVLAAVVTGAVVATGYDAQEAESLETSVWVTRSAGQYARVDTDLAQIDTVRDAEDPSGVAQSGSTSVVYTNGFQRMWPVDAADPRALISSAADGGAGAAGGTTPGGTRQVVASGDWTVYLTDTGRVFVANMTARGAAARPVQIDPLREERDAGDQEKPEAGYEASAVAVSDDGQVVLYSAKERAVRSYDAPTASFSGGAAPVASAPPADSEVLLTVVDGGWVLGAPGRDRVWMQDGDGPVTVELASDAVAQRGSSEGDLVYFADSEGLVSVDVAAGTASRSADATGTPAAPTRVGDVVYAAWLAPSGGTLWSSATGETTLEIPDGRLDERQDIAPVIATNGQRAVLNETTTGLLWTVPDGAVIPLSQWQADEDEDLQQQGTIPVEDVAQQEPPVAEADTFGVRAGATVSLPVLLNDHDPNRSDVLTVVPDSIAGGLSDPALGDIALTDDNQALVMRVRAQSGSATFSYSVGDGQDVSAAATVTVQIVPDDQNRAPVWCGVEGCLQEWPVAAVAPGGTVSVPVLDAWVDPDGDPFVLVAAAEDDLSAPLTIVPTADGRVAIRHTDANAGAATLSITVTVMDSRGARTSKQLSVAVSDDPPLETEPIVAIAGVGQARSVSLIEHVRGGSGSYRLVDAVASAGQAQAISVAPNVAAGTVELIAEAAGEYVVTYTVQDARTEAEQSGTLRFSVVSGSSGLAMPPLTAFVRAGEDTTLDVLDAVQNTSGRVLALDSATTSDAQLSVSVVEGARLRVSGVTADGQPGRVGTATVKVTDGATTATGTVTVFLAAAATGVGPIAMPDAVTVRAGAQVDIPVTDNDMAPRGERVVLHPDLQGSDAAGELAFAAGSDVRYLAPAEAGVYTLYYSVYLVGDPARLDTTSITVTVVAVGENLAPEPTTLTARVSAGQTVSIAVPASGMDPDGDATALVAVAQPKAGAGAAMISADGGSVTYTAPADGVEGGQVGFGYTLRDQQGAEGTGLIRLAVLAGELTEVTPVTYGDGVRAVIGSSETLTVQPTRNDRDPAGGALELVSLVPNAPDRPGDSEYDRLEALIGAGTDLSEGVVQLRAGTVAGVHSYVYTVRSTATSSTAQGLIVVTVADEAAPDQPVVTDTVMTIADRSALARGVDVVTGKTVWASGEVSTLRLAIWGESSSRYTVSGTRIAGPAPVEGALVPFSLTGEDGAGRAVVAYGFLRIPALDAMRVQLVPGIQPRTVDEDASVTIALDDAVQLDDGDRLQVQDGQGFAVQRPRATCTAAGSSAVRYSAGRDAPWTDSCTVALRVAGQQTWTLLPVPVVIQPSSPQALLTPISRTVAPGASQTIDLYAEMTSWEGGRVGDRSDLDYSVAFDGSNFTVDQSGSSLTVLARADAFPGARETATVTVSAFGGLSATVSLIVGAAPVDAPRGATFTQGCSVGAGPSCTVAVVGVSGEYDPFAGQPGAGLELAGIGEVGCAAAGISLSSPTTVTATWPSGPKPAGGGCIVPFTVVDAQGRTGPGTLTLDVQGFPAQPSSVTTSTFTGSSVTVLVALGEAASAYPAVSTVAIYENGQPVAASCAAAAAGTYSCTIGGLVNGQRHTYTARAVNAVGESVDTTPVVTWAYEPPLVTALSAAPVLVEGQTSTSRGGVAISIGAGEDVSQFQLLADSGEQVVIPRSGPVTEYTTTLPVGARTLTVIPQSQFQPPLGPGGAGSQAVTAVQVAGLPYLDSSGVLTPTSNTSLRLDGVQANGNFSAQPVRILYAVWPEGRPEPACSADRSGNPAMPGGQPGAEFVGLVAYNRYFAKACAGNGFGVAGSQVVDNYTFTSAPAAPSGLAYTVAPTPELQQSGRFVLGATYTDYTVPDVPSAGPNFATRYGSNYGDSDRLTLRPDEAPGAVSVRYCWNVAGVCGPSATITPATAPTTVTVVVDRSCVADPKPEDVAFSRAVDAAANRTVTVTADPKTETVTYRIAFAGPYSALAPVDLTRCYTPPPPPPPTTP